MTSAPVRDPVADHLLTPENAAFLLIDYQPSQLATVRSMDHDLLLKNAVSTVRAIKTFEVPVVHSTVNVAAGQGPTLPELAGLPGSETIQLVEFDCLPAGWQAFIRVAGGRCRPGRGRRAASRAPPR
jgi:nicotinamidase-related amidase